MSKVSGARYQVSGDVDQVDVDSDSQGPSGAFVGALIGMAAAGLLLLLGLCALADVLVRAFGGV